MSLNNPAFISITNITDDSSMFKAFIYDRCIYFSFNKIWNF